MSLVALKNVRINDRIFIEDLTFEKGTSVAVIGPNGAGKSTFFNLITGLTVADSGTILLGESKIEDLKPIERARRVSYLTQDFFYDFDYSVAEFVEMGLFASNSEATKVSEELERIDALPFLKRNIRTLSAGELQRIRIARTAIQRAPLWLLDEPTSNLDPKYSVSLLRRIQKYVTEGGGVVVATHDLNMIPGFFEKVLLIKEGRIIKFGKTEEVFNEENLSDLFEIKISSQSRYGVCISNLIVEENRK